MIMKTRMASKGFLYLVQGSLSIFSHPSSSTAFIIDGGASFLLIDLRISILVIRIITYRGLLFSRKLFFASQSRTSPLQLTDYLLIITILDKRINGQNSSQVAVFFYLLQSNLSIILKITSQRMNEEYKALGKSLLFFYITRLVIIGVFYFLGLSYVNDFFVQQEKQFSNHSSRMKFDQMVNILQRSKQTIRTLARMTQTVIKQQNKFQQVNFCKSNQSFNDCRNFLFNSIDNQLIYKTYGIYTSFTCLFGSCQEVSMLWDYYWTFRIRLPFISYLVIEYETNQTGSHKLIVPACSNISYNSTSNGQRWTLQNQNNNLFLSFNNKESSYSIKATLAFDSSKLYKNQGISLFDYQIGPNIQKLNPNILIYEIEGKKMFGYLPIQQKNVLRKWIYNTLIILGMLLFSFPVLYAIMILIDRWEGNLFKHLQPLKNLYKYQINAIFGGQKPKKSVILNETTFTYFFEDLSEVIQKDCEPIIAAQRPPQKEESFKFIPLIDRVMTKFQESLKPLQQQRTRQLTNLKPLMRSSINDISENVRQKLRELFIKSRQLLILPQFFYFGYLSLLSPTQVYESGLKEQRIALPDSMVSLFRYMNYTVNSTDLKFAFKFAFAYSQIIEQQIIMKLQDNLLQKYLSSLKDLDIGDPNYAVRLGLKKRLINLEKIMENKKHMFSVYLK